MDINVIDVMQNLKQWTWNRQRQSFEAEWASTGCILDRASKELMLVDCKGEFKKGRVQCHWDSWPHFQDCRLQSLSWNNDMGVID